MRPPIGLRPLKFAMEDRIKEVEGAIERYSKAKKDIPVKWMNELTTITALLLCAKRYNK